MDVTIVVATYGGREWRDLAWRRAMPSALDEGYAIHSHRDTLAEARNAGLESVETEWVVHLDADDELEPGYVRVLSHAHADLRAPAVRYVKNGVPRSAGLPRVAGHQHECVAECMAFGNWLVVGTAVRTELARRVGGWRDWPCYEDWDLWMRCWQAGASIEACPEAVYRAHVRRGSRNRGQAVAVKNRVHADIVDANGLVA